jgi:hypothetical protein
MRRLICATTLLTLTFDCSAANLDETLAVCAAISSDSARLQCYDQLAESTAASVVQPGVIPDDIGRKRERERKQEEAAAEVYDVTVKSCERSASSKRITFTLENGQVWRQKNSRWLSLRDCKGGATIESGYFGYTLYIAAMNKSIGVIRVD